MSKGSKQRPTDKDKFDANFDRIFKEKPFDKLFLGDEIFNTEMFGEVRVSRCTVEAADRPHTITRVDTKKDGEYFTCSIKGEPPISAIIKELDNLYILRSNK